MSDLTSLPWKTAPAIERAAFNPDEVRNVLGQLSAHFGIVAPKFNTLSPRTKRGFYRPATGEIFIGHGTWCGWHAVIHEFAHHLHNVKQAEAHANTVNKWFFRRERAHGVEFCRWLLQVVNFAFADPKAYMWTREYRSIRAWAAKRGLCEPRQRFTGGWLVLKPVVPVITGFDPAQVVPQVALARPTATVRRAGVLTQAQRDDMRRLRAQDPDRWTFRRLGAEFGCTDTTAYRICVMCANSVSAVSAGVSAMRRPTVSAATHYRIEADLVNRRRALCPRAVRFAETLFGLAVDHRSERLELLAIQVDGWAQDGREITAEEEARVIAAAAEALR